MEIKTLVKTSKLKKLPFIAADLTKHDHVGGGIYRFYNAAGEIIYVGKSVDLHRRLHQHIGKDTNTAYFIDEVDFIEWLLDDDPVSQTFLEGIFIAYHLPKYNDEVKHTRKEG